MRNMFLTFTVKIRYFDRTTCRAFDIFVLRLNEFEIVTFLSIRNFTIRTLKFQGIRTFVNSTD